MATNLALRATAIDELPIRRPLKLARNRPSLKKQKILTYPNSLAKRALATALVAISAALIIFYI